MADGTALYRASVRGAGAAASRFSRLQREVQRELISELRHLGSLGELIYSEHAPEDTEQLKENIRAVFFFRARQPRVTIEARAPGHGGDPRDYVNITRRGHQPQWILPKHSRALKVMIEGHRSPHIFIFRGSVAGYDPEYDWAEDAAAEMAEELEDSGRRVGRAVRSVRV